MGQELPGRACDPAAQPAPPGSRRGPALAAPAGRAWAGAKASHWPWSTMTMTLCQEFLEEGEVEQALGSWQRLSQDSGHCGQCRRAPLWALDLRTGPSEPKSEPPW